MYLFLPQPKKNPLFNIWSDYKREDKKVAFGGFFFLQKERVAFCRKKREVYVHSKFKMKFEMKKKLNESPLMSFHKSKEREREAQGR